ncbi:hypothetical protein SLEP1_g19915 [Rubroshorea leprosula]|uniref:Uncharacterized protein n=1 Tax=Rubroshorea leprosula TaxID=152421 RepID=A0AAV5J6E3_9ROSI|nr:hypothetical protein SLEP1_g19915 [Rubroshorea leprosula]
MVLWCRLVERSRAMEGFFSPFNGADSALRLLGSAASPSTAKIIIKPQSSSLVFHGKR